MMAKYPKKVAGKYPVRVVFRFKSVRAKNYFIAELRRGSGKELCELHWPYKNNINAETAQSFQVEVLDNSRVIDDVLETESDRITGENLPREII